MSIILIVEDDKSIRYNLMTFLMAEGYEVLVASNGLDAYSKAKANNPDLILTDIHMPVMDGIELSKILQNDPNTALIPLIFLTSDMQLINSGRINGCANACIPKPFHLDQILESINRLKNHSNDVIDKSQ